MARFDRAPGCSPSGLSKQSHACIGTSNLLSSTQPLLCTIIYYIANYLMTHGLRPPADTGHSIIIPEVGNMSIMVPTFTYKPAVVTFIFCLFIIQL